MTIFVRFWLCIALAVVALWVAILPAGAPDKAEDVTVALTGTVTHVRDGDTIEVDDVPIRLEGIAAPELNEPGGQEATTAMKTLVEGKKVLCELTGERSYDRMIGVCYYPALKHRLNDLGYFMVSSGHARDCPRFSKGRYAQYELATVLRTYMLPRYCKPQ